ncbi:G-PROTEIN-RECEP-F1-2 domain-containing protein [Aphelenchoides fujianensis]|nr:G-PROTEIN-RECEP-F1-2 domain-containing protein [Aphelenchoides fujianensis]
MLFRLVDAWTVRNHHVPLASFFQLQPAACRMSFFKPVENESLITERVPALQEYVPNSIIYVLLYVIALPPNILLAYLGLKPGLVTSRVKYPTLGMTIANLFGLVGFLLLNFVYLFAVFNEFKLSLFMASFLRTVLYNTSYVCYFLFPLLAIDQYLFVCRNHVLTKQSLIVINAICFAIPMLVAVYDLFLQNTVLWDYMFSMVKMSPYSNVFFFFVLAPSFFIFSTLCNLLVLWSILRRQSKTARKSTGRSLNPRQLQQQKGVVLTYTLQAFLPLLLAMPYYVANLCFMFGININMEWFVLGEAVIALHPLTNSLTTLLLLRPYRKAFKKICPLPILERSKQRQYDAIGNDPKNTQNKKETDTASDEASHSHSRDQQPDSSNGNMTAVSL